MRCHATLAALALVTPVFAAADDRASHAYSIDAQDLSGALRAFALQSQREIFFTPELTRGKQSQGVKGYYEDLSALETILRGTDRTYTVTASKAILVICPDKPVADGRLSAHSDKPAHTAQVATPPAANPTSSGGTEHEAGLEIVVVTAQKRSENIQSVPISITAMDRAQLERMQIHSIMDLTKVVPNLSLRVSGAGGESQPTYSIRGINTADSSAGQNGPVAVYYDEVYKGGAPLQGIGVFDLERVEVLKGPQGTLYGKNTTGGAINLVTRVPDFTTESNLTLSFGNYNHFRADGGGQTAITDAVAVRLAFTKDRADGWFPNNAPDAPDAASTDNYALRGTLLITPTDESRVILRGSISRSNPIGQFRGWYPTTAQGIGPPFYPALGAGGVLLSPLFNTDPRVGYSVSPGHDNLRTNALSATAILKLSDGLELGSITSWDRGVIALRHGSYTPLQFLDNHYYTNTAQVSGDLRLTSRFASPFNFILGAYYNREEVHTRNRATFLADIDVNHDGAVNAADCSAGNYFAACSITNQFVQIKKSAAVYTDESYALTDHFKLHAGLRYTHDQGDLPDFIGYWGDVTGNPILNTIPGPGSVYQPVHFTNSNVSGRLGVDYNVSKNIMLYASANRGYRGGTFNNQAYYNPGEINVAPPETLTSYEVGFKTESFEHRVRFNGAAFEMEYEGQQVLTYDVATNSNILVSLGNSRVRGAEFELEVQATEGVTLFTSVGLLNTRILHGVVSGVDVSGRPLQNAPSNTASAGLDWQRTLGGRLRYDLHLDAGYTGPQRMDLNNNPRTRAGGYALLNGRLRFSNSAGQMGVSLWATNLLNRYYAEYIAPLNFVGAYDELPNAPRMYGVSIDAKF